MSDLSKCLVEAVKLGKLSEHSKNNIEKSYKKALEDGKTTDEAKIKALKEAQYKAQRQKRLSIINAQARQRLEFLAKKHPKGMASGIMSMLTKDINESAGNSNIFYRSQAILGISTAKFADAMNDMRSKLAGFKQDKALAQDVVREIFGTSTDNSKASGYAKLWADIAEDLRKQFNSAGGDIPKLKDWGMPQSHNQMKVARVDADEWIGFIKDKLDFQKMDLKESEVKEALEYMHETISTGGLNKLQAGKIPKGVTSVKANSKREHRLLVFKDADAWLEYQEKFGQPDPFTAMTDHTRQMANDIATMEIFGANPDANFNFIKDVARKEKQLSKSKEWWLDGSYNSATGKVDGTSAVTSGDFATVAILGGIRSVFVASKLGSAMISALTDVSNLALTANYNKMPVMKTLYKGFASLGREEQQKMAVQMGIVADAWSGNVSAASRFGETGAGKLEGIAEKVIRASGLGAWTDAFRKSFGMELMAKLAENTKKPFDELDPYFKKVFTQKGITPEDWKVISETSLMGFDGAEFLSVENLMSNPKISSKKSRELAIKMMEFVAQETDYAVIVPDARVRAITTGGKQKGTLGGETSRMLWMFKSFPIAMLTSHISRGLAQDTIKGKSAYLASVFTGTTILAMGVIQLKEMIKGKDPKEVDLSLAGASVLQGGGLGIFGDFLFSDKTRYGNSFSSQIVGPMGSLGEDVLQITMANLQKALDKKKDTTLGKDLITKASSYLPGQNLWYTRLLFERLVKDQALKLVDPKFNKKVSNHERKLKRDNHQGYWWGRGDTTPSKAPDLLGG